jgi:hypothetical protein
MGCRFGGDFRMTCFCYLCTLLECLGNALQIDICNKDYDGVDTKPKDDGALDVYDGAPIIAYI